MSERPGSTLAARPLHFFIVADCSGSMASDGKMQALNNAIRETIPHLVDVASQNPHARMLVRVIAFASGARWHIAEPVPVEQLRWTDLVAHGYTDLGAAISLLSEQLRVPPMEERALPPAVLLISDGMPTDDFKPALGASRWVGCRSGSPWASAETPTWRCSNASWHRASSRRSVPTTPNNSSG